MRVQSRRIKSTGADLREETGPPHHLLTMSDVQMETAESHRLFTVGHSNLEAEGLLGLLRAAGVTAVADVRSSPYSRRLPQFNRAALEASLRAAGIAYVFLGAELGGRPA